jgi:hypothetical protein
MIQYDVRSDQMILPRFMGTPCGAVFRDGRIFVLTTEGEIFKLQIHHQVSENGKVVDKGLIHCTQTCIVEAPNRCVIERVHFEKGTEHFPVMRHIWNPQDCVALKPTCLLDTPQGLLVVHCEYKVIWEVFPNGSNNEGPAAGWYVQGIRVHAGKPRVGHGVTHRERGQGQQDQTTVEFDEPRCAVLDGNKDLWVCDRDWLRKIAYDKQDLERTTFTVSNEVGLTGEFPTSIAMGAKGFVLLEHYSDLTFGTRWKPRLLDVQWLNLLDKEGKVYKEIRKSSLIKDLGPNDIGSIILDSKDQIIFCETNRNNVRCVDRAPYVWGGPPESPYPYRENDEGTDDVIMKGFLFGGKTTCHLTWYRGSIALLTTSKDGPILVLLGKQPTQPGKRAADGAADGDELRAAARPSTAPAGRGQALARPSTAPAGRGRGRGLPRAEHLLLQLAELCL